MSKINYKQMLPWEKHNLEKLCGNKPTLEPIYGSTSQGWKIIKYKFLVNVSYFATLLHRDRKTIKNELIRGKYLTLSNDVSKENTTFSYSKCASDFHHKQIWNDKKKQNCKILQNDKIKEFVKTRLHKQSLKSIAGRSKKLFKDQKINWSISSQTLYNYISNDTVDFIDDTSLKRKRKRLYRMKKHAKRLNGVSIDQRPGEINKRETFGHWELDLIEGKRNTKFNLLTMCERKTKFGFAIKILGKSKEMINSILKQLQEKDILRYGDNILSITTDNGSEFWGWEKFRKSIWNKKDDIDVYFCHPYASYEKGSIENFNLQMRFHFPKGTDFTNVSQEQINSSVDQVNNIYREILGYATAKEAYNEYVQI